jgi:GTPase
LIDLLADTAEPLGVLVGVQLPDVTDLDFQSSQKELGRLGKTLGVEVFGRIGQKRTRFDPATYLGAGKVEELKDLIEESQEAWPSRDHLVLVDHEITPSQARQLGKAVNATVLDRTAVILEIFHRHACSRAAKAQVEIVRLAYMAPRMRELRKGKGDRQRGGIGGKGAGESDLELDRRKVRDRIAELRAELVRIEQERSTQRARRTDLRRVALVGYTNAGKSTLMRALTGSKVLVEDKLFATLDTTVRALHPAVKPRVLVSDTVGFIRKLPHDLVASFQSTLDEALEASVLLHVTDASDDALDDHLQTTSAVLDEIGASEIPTLLVLNKADRVKDPARLQALRLMYPDALLVSSKDAEDVQRVHAAIISFFEGGASEEWVELSHAHGAARAALFELCDVIAEKHDEQGGRYHVRATEAALVQVRSLLAAPA